MALIRYFVEHLPKAKSPHHATQKSTVRFHSSKHVWARIDDNTIVVMAHFSDATNWRPRHTTATY